MCTQMNSSLDASRGATQADLFLIADLWRAMLLRRRVAASGPGRLAFRTSDLLAPVVSAASGLGMLRLGQASAKAQGFGRLKRLSGRSVSAPHC
jgi:hypothetical protein